MLRLVLVNDDRRAAIRGSTHAATNLGENVLFGIGGVVVDVLRRVQAQAVQVKLIDPVCGIRGKVLADRPGIEPVEVDRLAPLGLVLVGEIGWRKCLEIVAVGPQMVVDDIQNHAEAELVGSIDKAAEVVRRSVEPRRSIQIDPVVTPAEGAREIGDRHDLQAGDPNTRELW